MTEISNEHESSSDNEVKEITELLISTEISDPSDKDNPTSNDTSISIQDQNNDHGDIKSYNWSKQTGNKKKAFGQSKNHDETEPPPTFPSFSEYFVEMCHHLFLQQIREIKPIIVRPNSLDQKIISIELKYKPLLNHGIMTNKDLVLERSPFRQLQTLFFMANGRIWAYFINEMRMQRWRETIDLELELYPWYTPRTIPLGARSVQMVPTSIPIGRCITAMNSLNQSKFGSLILGGSQLPYQSPLDGLVFENSLLTEMQRKAIASSLSNSVTFIKGPPGTGKTSTITEMIKQFHKQKDQKVVIVAASNVAVDNVCEKLMDDLKILRVVGSTREKEYDQDHPLSSVCLHQQVRKKLTEEQREVLDQFDEKEIGYDVKVKALLRVFRENPATEVKALKVLISKGLSYKKKERDLFDFFSLVKIEIYNKAIFRSMSDSVYRILQSLKREKKLLFDTISQSLNDRDLSVLKKLTRKKYSAEDYKKVDQLMFTMKMELMNENNIILATSTASGGKPFKDLNVSVVIMDESTQSSETVSLIPLALKGIQNMVFVGDEKQLSSFADIPYLEQSLFERVLKNGTCLNPFFLDVQYRMNPSISFFPIKYFYDGQLKDGVTHEQRSLGGVPPILFIDYFSHTHLEERESKVISTQRGRNSKRIPGSYFNSFEVEILLKLLKGLILKDGVNPESIAIITPYSGQRDLITREIRQDVVLNPNGDTIHEEIPEETTLKSAKKPTTFYINGFTVSSIDAYQGHENDIVIFSCVRSNLQSKVGFLNEPRRVNVALTRARKSLLIIGSAETFSKGDEIWSELITHLKQEDRLVHETKCDLLSQDKLNEGSSLALG